MHDPSSEVKKDPEEHDVQPLLDALLASSSHNYLYFDCYLELSGNNFSIFNICGSK